MFYSSASRPNSDSQADVVRLQNATLLGIDFTVCGVDSVTPWPSLDLETSNDKVHNEMSLYLGR